MKQVLTFFFASILLNSIAQQTYVPDDNFELYLELNGMGNGIIWDDSITTANVANVTYLDVSMQSISDLTGIEAFASLITLKCGLNPQLAVMNLSQNTLLQELHCQNTNLTTLNVSQNVYLKKLFFPGNSGIGSINLTQNTSLTYLFFSQTSISSIDLSQNLLLDTLSINWNSFSSIDLSQNTALIYLNCSANPMTSLDLSQNMELVYLDCSQSLLECLNVRNGNNNNFVYFKASSNSNLTCIEVDNPTWSSNNWLNIDTQMSFSENCNNACSVGIEELSIGGKELIKIVDLMGRETTPQKNKVLIYVYSDGTTERVFEFE